jgi:hypothetical protein
MGHIECFVPGDDHAYVLADASEAYRPKLLIHRADRHIHAVWNEETGPYVIWIDDFEADGPEHLYSLMLHTAEGNRFVCSENRFRIQGKQDFLDVQLATTSPATFREESYGHPRLHIDQKGQRVRYVMLMHPRRAETSGAAMRVEMAEDSIAVEVELAGKTARHVFDTGEREAISSGIPPVTVKGPIF